VGYFTAKEDGEGGTQKSMTKAEWETDVGEELRKGQSPPGRGSRPVKKQLDKSSLRADITEKKNR